jgi:hypothetical protein
VQAVDAAGSADLFQVLIENPTPEHKRAAVEAFRTTLFGPRKRKPRPKLHDTSQFLLFDSLKGAAEWFRVLTPFATAEIRRQFGGPLKFWVYLYIAYLASWEDGPETAPIGRRPRRRGPLGDRPKRPVANDEWLTRWVTLTPIEIARHYGARRENVSHALSALLTGGLIRREVKEVSKREWKVRLEPGDQWRRAPGAADSGARATQATPDRGARATQLSGARATRRAAESGARATGTTADSRYEEKKRDNSSTTTDSPTTTDAEGVVVVEGISLSQKEAAAPALDTRPDPTPDGIAADLRALRIGRDRPQVYAERLIAIFRNGGRHPLDEIRDFKEFLAKHGAHTNAGGLANDYFKCLTEGRPYEAAREVKSEVSSLFVRLQGETTKANAEFWESMSPEERRGHLLAMRRKYPHIEAHVRSTLDGRQAPSGFVIDQAREWVRIHTRERMRELWTKEAAKEVTT